MLRALLCFVMATCSAVAAAALDIPEKPEGAIRFATYNVALYGDRAGGLIARLRNGADPQARASAEIIQRVRPDVLLIQEIDRDDAGEALNLYLTRFLGVAQNGAEPIIYPHRLLLPTNTGVASGVDISGDGRVGREGILYAIDAKGYGVFPGQYGFSLVSMLPLGEARTFSDFLWRDMPGHRMQRKTPEAVREVLPLSSKTHALIPVEVEGGPIYVAAAHPTPPINPAAIPRNADEIRFLVDLLHEARSHYATDDNGVVGGLPAGSYAVAMGDLNADPESEQSDALDGAITYLLDDPRMNDPVPMSQEGALTAAFRRASMRVDYVVPTANLEVVQSGVVWPEDGSPLEDASDHRLVFVDIKIP
ncbi:MAG: endonuclease/exonuclease/phosphatase family protein [Pseudomonadota bacterium]